MKRKTSMNLLDLIAWVNKYGKRLEGSVIQNAYYNGKLLWLKLRSKTGNVTLLIEPGKAAYVTSRKLQAPERLHPFAGGLRKYLNGGKIISVDVLGHDRILSISIMARGEEFRLIGELIPRGVITLIDKDGKILYANEYKEMRDRVIKRLEKYVPPPSPQFDPFTDLDDLKERISKGKDVVRGLVLGQKLPADVAEEVIARANVDKSKKPRDLTEDEVEELRKAIREVYEESMLGKGYLYYLNGRLYAFEPFKSVLLTESGFHFEEGDFNEVLDKYFTEFEGESVEEDVQERIEIEVEKLKKAMEKQKALVEEYKRRAEEYRELATKIALNYAEVEEQLRKGRKIKVDDIEVEVPPKLTLDEFIRELYSKATNYEKKYKKALKALDELKKQLEDVETKVLEEIAKEKAKVRRREWYEKYHWLITRNGLLAIGGRDASQNEAVVRRYLEEEDYFLHAEVQGAPAVVLKGEATEADLYDAACLTACYSKAWKDGRASVDVFYVKGSQVSKSPPSGQYVAKGAFIIKGRREHVRNVPLRLGIGIELFEGSPRVIVGPPDLIKERSVVYAILVPGDEEKRKIAERLKKVWTSKIEDPQIRGLIEGIDINEIVQRIPGKANVIKIGKGEKSQNLPSEETRGTSA
ncbi:hypothetical protein EYM_04410 [Ignicoccus islandicus DSM 13165]|uniref:NFACT RNA-binding domain-containing protein n=1 Tax=Ignicoccus islandicus DSM 13165 TaxID=940295 RepID=A0A0U3F9Z8_9CREN|nr:NFACT family protein [Ignicoccus islandicus]ALU12489.1 hypothetical protein EYM_04410 [Ignicoccus islandicus DSM 13165]